jgi:hypothetical protein
VALLVSLGLGVVATLHITLAALAMILGSLIVCVLWLDVVLYRLFTVELGADGVVGAVLSNLYRETVQMHATRQLFAQNRTFGALPFAALAAHLLLALPAGSTGRIGLLVGLAIYLGCGLSAVRSGAAAWAVWLSLLASLLSELALRDGRAEPAWLASVLALGLYGAAALASGLQAAGALERRALLHELVQSPPAVISRTFTPRLEHAPLLDAAPFVPRPSPQHGQLAGTSIVLLTFESLGETHLGGRDRAHTPFLDGLVPRSVRSASHFCLAPLTNSAHIALYSSGYDASFAQSGLAPLKQAGYQTIYLTTTATVHYGLGDILRRAGFDHVVDQRAITARSGRSSLSDYALLDPGLALIEPLLRRGPFFLHVHATDTHLPYRVNDPRRFCRHGSILDRGRFLNSIEETDWLFGELWAALQSMLNPEPPLLVVSSDHGQSFGEQGYFSHGSAVIDEQIHVPLRLCHPRLAARSVRFSTHFDVLPTLHDLLGYSTINSGFGESILHADRRVQHILWDGKPSRSTSNCLGLLLDDKKYTLDRLRGVCLEADWHDQNLRMLHGSERDYWQALLMTLAQRRGVL